eukprot:scaffold30998_cov80-Cyclotella_meneghiniana.AAC.4
MKGSCSCPHNEDESKHTSKNNVNADNKMSSFTPYFKSNKSIDDDRQCYSSPETTYEEDGRKSILCSPPPMLPRKFNELSPGSLDSQLQSGRSLFHSKPPAINQRILDLHSNVGAPLNDEVLLSFPAYPQTSPRAAMAGSPKSDDETPAIITPIKLKMRSIKHRHDDDLPVTNAKKARIKVDCMFAPIKNEEDPFA